VFYEKNSYNFNTFEMSRLRNRNQGVNVTAAEQRICIFDCCKSC